MIARINPVDEAFALADTVNRVLDNAFGRSTVWAGTGTPLQGFPLNVYARADDLVVEALLPGIGQNDVQIEIDRGVLTISASRPAVVTDTTAAQPTWYLREVASGQFRRAISLPFPIDAEKAKATFTEGQLTLVLPKAEAARPRQIKIAAPANTVVVENA